MRHQPQVNQSALSDSSPNSREVRCRHHADRQTPRIFPRISQRPAVAPLKLAAVAEPKPQASERYLAKSTPLSACKVPRTQALVMLARRFRIAQASNVLHSAATARRVISSTCHGFMRKAVQFVGASPEGISARQPITVSSQFVRVFVACSFVQNFRLTTT